MGRWAQVHTASGFVVNVIEWEGGFDAVDIPPGYEMIEDSGIGAGPGMTWDGAKFVQAPGPEPKPEAPQPAEEEGGDT